MINNDSILVLVPLHKDKRDIAGTLYTHAGDIVTFPDFINDGSVYLGLSGYKINEDKIYSFSQLFALVKVDSHIDIPPNLVKFENGYIVAMGTKNHCISEVEKYE